MRIFPFLPSLLLIVPLVSSAQPQSVSSALSGQVELPRLLDLASERLGMNLEYDPGALKGPVTVRAGTQLTDAELWDLANRVLASRGFTTIRVPGPNAYAVVKIADAGGSSRFEEFMPKGTGPDPGFRTLVLRAEHRPARELVEAIGRVLSKPGGSVYQLGDGGLLVLSDLSTRLDQAMDVLRLLDVPAAGAIIEEVTVRAMPAAQLASIVSQVAARRELVSGEKIPGEVLVGPGGDKVLIVAPQARLEHWRSLVARLDQRDRVEMVTYTPRYFGAGDVGQLIDQTVKGIGGVADDRWRLVVDELTGSLVITATPAQHDAIRSLLERLDQVPPPARRPVRTFVIRNRDVNEVRSTLDQLLRAGIIGGDGEAEPERGTSRQPAIGEAPVSISLPPSPAAQSTPLGTASGALPGVTARGLGYEESSVQITVDPGTSTLIAIGDPRTLSQIESLLRTLDVRQPQVMLEVMMISMSESQAMELGVELEQITIAGDVRIRLASLFGLGTRDSGGNRVAGDAAGFTGVVLSPGDFSVVLRALQTLNRGRALSMPKLLVANNQNATINSVLNQPYVSINATNTVSTTSFGGSVDAGTQVSIKPQIAEGDSLILDYRISLSSFVGAAPAPSVPPPRQQNSISSMATIPDGYTVVVGGIELASDTHGTTQVPGIGSIPVLGELFKTRSNSSNRSRFYVFIRANVLRERGFEDLKYISDQDIARVDIDDGWPVVEPRIIR
jgi:general secretion pathway protein D